MTDFEVLIYNLEKIWKWNLLIKRNQIINFFAARALFKPFCKFPYYKPVLIKLISLNSDLLFVLRDEDRAHAAIVVLETDVSSLLPAFVAVLSIKHI